MPNILDIVQIGGIGIAGLALWILWKIVNNHENHFVSVIRENNEAIRRQAVSNQRLTDVIENLISLISQKFSK